MALSFESYLDSMYGAPGSAQASRIEYDAETRRLQEEHDAILKKHPFGLNSDGAPTPDSKRLTELRMQLNQRRKAPGIPEQITSAYADARAATMAGTVGAANLIQQAYEDQFAHRAGTLVGSNRETASRIRREAGPTGLSSDLSRRMLLENDSRTIEDVGLARGESQAAKGFDLASLVKSSATERAGLLTGEAGAQIDYSAAKMGADATKSAGKSSALATFGAGLLSLF